MKYKYRVSHHGLKPGVIIDFDSLEDAMLYAELTKKYTKISGYKIRKVDVKPIYTTELTDEEE